MARVKTIYNCERLECIKTRQKLEKFRQFVQRVVDAFPCATFSGGDKIPVWVPEWLIEDVCRGVLYTLEHLDHLGNCRLGISDHPEMEPDECTCGRDYSIHRLCEVLGLPGEEAGDVED